MGRTDHRHELEKEVLMPVCPQGHTSDTDDFCEECGRPMNGAPGSSVSGSSVSGSSVSGSSVSGSSVSGSSVSASSVSCSAAPAAASASSASPGAAPGAASGSSSGDGEVCPWCGTPRDGRFCEEDGYDFVLAPGGPGPGEPSSTAAFPSPTTSGSRSVPTPAATSAPPGASPGGWAVRVEADRRYFESVLERRGPDIETVTFPTYYPRTEVPLAGEEMRIGRRRASSTTRGPEIDLTGPPLDPGVSRLHAVLLAGPSGWSVLDPGSTNGTTINYADEPIATDTPVPVADGDRIHVGAYTTLVVVHGG